jgi:hypothetical protein
MGSILIIAGIAGLVLTGIAAPIAVVVLRRQVKKLSERIQQEYEQ